VFRRRWKWKYLRNLKVYLDGQFFRFKEEDEDDEYEDEMFIGFMNLFIFIKKYFIKQSY